MEPGAEDTTPSRPLRWVIAAFREVGLLSLWNSSINVKLLCLQRFVRLFAYGASALILVAYLRILGTSDTRTGLFMTLTLGGDVLISLGLTLVADSLGRRKVLALGALLMTASGVVFALSSSYWILLTAAVLGVITPSGNEIGPFRAIEESTLAHLTKPEERSAIFAWYTLLGTAGVALGLMACGWVTTSLIEGRQWDAIDAYRATFMAYAVLGAVKLVLSLLLGRDCEVNKQPLQANPTETAPLLNGNTSNGDDKKRSKFALLPQLSRESKIILLQLCILIAFDSFASGLAPLYVVLYSRGSDQLTDLLLQIVDCKLLPTPLRPLLRRHRLSLLHHFHHRRHLRPVRRFAGPPHWQRQDNGLHTSPLLDLPRPHRHTVSTTHRSSAGCSPSLLAKYGHCAAISIPSRSCTARGAHGYHGRHQRSQDTHTKSGAAGHWRVRRKGSILGRFPGSWMLEGVLRYWNVAVVRWSQDKRGEACRFR